MAITLNKSILHKIERASGGDEAMLDYIRDIIGFELSDKRQYVNYYKKAITAYSKQSKGE